MTADTFVCCLCRSRFRLNGSRPRQIVVTDDGESMTIAPVCPDCEQDRREDLEEAARSHAAWQVEATC